RRGMAAPAEADAERLRDDAALVGPGAREVVRGTGADRIAFLHRLLTGDVEGIAVGRGSRSLLLDLKAHVVSDMRLFVLADAVAVVGAAGQGATTAAALGRYAIMDDFTATLDPALALLALHGPRADARAAAAGVAVPPDLTAPWSHAVVRGADGPLWLVRAR